jgi:hypothetical protein
MKNSMPLPARLTVLAARTAGLASVLAFVVFGAPGEAWCV